MVHQNDCIIQLLSEYQDTKRIIEKLMGDNEVLLMKNEQLAKEVESRGSKEDFRQQKLPAPKI